jgi:hypothetical protein
MPWHAVLFADLLVPVTFLSLDATSEQTALYIGTAKAFENAPYLEQVFTRMENSIIIGISQAN